LTLHLPDDVVPKFLRLLKDSQASADAHLQTATEKLHSGIKLARMCGVSIPAIADATGLSVSRVHSIVGAADALRIVTDEEIEHVVRYAPDVVIVPAGWVGYPEYRRYSAYVCQRGRNFNGDPRRMGFYFHKQVMPEIPLILHVRDHVPFTSGHVAELRERGEDYDEQVAALIEQMLADRSRSDGFVGKVFLLSTDDDDERTMFLQQPIQHTTTGAGTGFVRKHRYVSEGALRNQPKTTAELLEYERAPIRLPWSTDSASEAGV